MSVKAVGMAIKLTFEGDNQFFYPHTWLFVGVVVMCGVTQLNYLNKVFLSCKLCLLLPFVLYKAEVSVFCINFRHLTHLIQQWSL